MKPLRNHRSRAFTLIELSISVAVIAVLVAILLPELRSRRRSSRLGCTNNLKQIGLAFRTWALDNNDRLPMQVSVTNGGTMELVDSGKVFNHFQVMSNELSTPKLLFCPEENDTRRTQANSFAMVPGFADSIPFTNNNEVSYFVGVDADSKWPQMFLSGDRNLAVNEKPLSSGLSVIPTNIALTWFQPRHDGGGNICFADGSVNQFDAPALRGSLRATGVATSRLAIP